MAETSYPFDNSTVATELQWSKMFRLLMPNGVDGLPTGTDLKVTGTTLTLDVAAGAAWLRGFYYVNDATRTVALPTNASGNPRIDAVVLRASLTSNTITVAYVQGTPAASPVAPTLTQNDTTGIYEMPLAHVRVETSNATTVTDRRRFVGRPTVFCTSANRPDPEGRPLLAFETDTDRVIFSNGTTWVAGLTHTTPTYTYIGTAGTTTSTTAWDTTLTGTTSLISTFAAPPSGNVVVRVGAYLANDAAANTYLGLKLVQSGGTVVWDNTYASNTFSADRFLQFKSGNAVGGASCSATYHAALVPGASYTITVQYGVSAGTATIRNRWLEITPLP